MIPKDKQLHLAGGAPAMAVSALLVVVAILAFAIGV